MERIFVVARSEERKKCQDMGRAQSLLDAEVNRLEELQSYRENYERRMSSGDEIHPAHWTDYQNFLRRLSDAVTEQQRHVLTGQENRDLHRKHWMAKRKRLDSLQRVVDRYRQAEDREAEQKLQKSLDDRPPSKSLFNP